MICAWMVIGMMMMMTFFDANSTNEIFILSDGPTPDQAE